MNHSNPLEQTISGIRRFVLEMIGFSEAEKRMLSSTFRLTGRRDFCYIEPSSPDQRADVYLINSDNAEVVASLDQLSLNVHSPAVFIGREAIETEWPFIQKPIQWMRLFEQLDDVTNNALIERSRREQNPEQPSDEKWDGQTYRRSIDKKPDQEPEFAPELSAESVLVVDDSATVRAFMRMKLAPFHFDVDFAENGEKAIDMAQAKTYTCIFLDIMMPGIDGYEVCKRIKSNSETKKTAVVMLTSKTGMLDKFRGNWSGCDAYLGKPVAENDLLATIAKFLPSSREN